MDSQMARPHGHGHEQEPHVVENQMEGQGEHHHEKKSVVNRVKAKARKIKDTLTMHGHGHNHDHDLDEEDDDEEMVEDTEIHGAPLYDPAVIKSVGTMEASGQSGVNDGRSTAMDVDPLPPARTVNPLAASHVHEQEENKGQPKVNVGLTSVVDEAPKAPQNTPVSDTSTTTNTHHIRDQNPTRTFIPGQEEHSRLPKVNLQRPKGGLVKDPASPKATPGAYTPSNYQTKVTDPTGKGGEEAGISPDLSSFEKMSISDESKSKSGQEQNWPTGTENFYTSLATGSHDQFSPELAPPKPVTGEAFHSTRTQDHPHDDSAEIKEALDSSRDTDRQSNSYTEKISSASATSTIADKAISAKNVEATKLGSGEQGNTGGHEMHATGDKSKSSKPASTVGYGKKIAVTVTEKLSPVYEKVAGAGSTLMSKIPGTTNTGSEKEHGVGEKEHGIGGQDKGVSVKDYWAEKLSPGEEDRALSEVITEALHKKKAEQENKSMSCRPTTEVVSDAWHKRREEPDDVTSRPTGKLTESEEVAMRFGTTEHDSSKEGTDSSFVNNSDKGMVEKIKGAVGSWFGGKGEVREETRGSQQSHSAPIGSAFDETGHNTNNTTGERRLQESGN